MSLTKEILNGHDTLAFHHSTADSAKKILRRLKGMCPDLRWKNGEQLDEYVTPHDAGYIVVSDSIYSGRRSVSYSNQDRWENVYPCPVEEEQRLLDSIKLERV